MASQSGIGQARLMQAIERLNYRATVGDVAAQAGVDLNLAQQGLLALASEAGGHLQVVESGEIVFAFPQNFRSILRSKHFRIRLQEAWNKVWQVLFYVIRISFGVALLASIVLISVAIVLIVTALNSSQDNNNDRGGDFLPTFWFSPDFFWIFSPSYSDDRPGLRQRSQNTTSMNFLEAVFSFLFGDGNPNADREERRWQTIGRVIRNRRGAVVAEQIAPYLDNLGQGFAHEYEEYMLPVLTRFNGQPEVSPTGAIVYRFPDLQTTVAQTSPQPVAAYLKERLWHFSRAGSGQLILAALLGGVNLVGALTLGKLLQGAAFGAGFLGFVQSIYGLLLAYGLGFVLIPLGRYFWIQWRNAQIAQRNQERQARAEALNQADPALEEKIAYAQQFAAETVIGQEDLIYSTDRDLIEQESEQTERIDAEWQRRLSQKSD